MVQIFLSYGHDEHVILAEQLKNDLEKEGYIVWFDRKEIKPQNYWEHTIEKGIEKSKFVIVLMTPHSMRRPDGVCLDEVSYARYRGKDIIPIMVQSVQPPLSIARIQWLDLQDYKQPQLYQKGYKELCKIIGEEYKLGHEGDLVQARNILSPLDDRIEIGRHMAQFTGREWLMDEYNRWLNDFSSMSRVFWIKGPAGVGKSAFAAKIANESKHVVGVHFFKHHNSDKREARRAILTLAYYLATQIPDYLKYILNLPDFDPVKIAQKNVTALFNYVLVEPLLHIPPPEQQCVFVLDALDEAEELSDLLMLINQEFCKIPRWLGLVITSRPEANIVRRLGNLKPFEIDPRNKENLYDIEKYLKLNLEKKAIDYSQETLTELVKRSEGIFLYITEVMKALEGNKLLLENINSLPTGLTEIYTYFFERQFPVYDLYKKQYRPFLELVMSSPSPLPIEVADTIMGWSEYEKGEILEGIESIFHVENSGIEPFHKSIQDWITDKTKCGHFVVYKKYGQQRLLEYCTQQYYAGVNKMSSYAASNILKLLLNEENWTLIGEILTNNDYVKLKIKQDQSMELLDFYEKVIGRLTPINPVIADKIKRYFLKNRLRIVFKMDNHLTSI